jgi:hypothetical protein
VPASNLHAAADHVRVEAARIGSVGGIAHHDIVAFVPQDLGDPLGNSSRPAVTARIDNLHSRHLKGLSNTDSCNVHFTTLAAAA